MAAGEGEGDGVGDGVAFAAGEALGVGEGEAFFLPAAEAVGEIRNGIAAMQTKLRNWARYFMVLEFEILF